MDTAMRHLTVPSVFMVLARLLVLAGIGMCLTKTAFPELALGFIAVGGLLSIASYFIKRKTVAE
ncbi:hypothetical protein [Rufibacter ruber]|uniref:hypothetical protein n=1 Tax=Rufibacter ruber TaxID=1783499 RepID=UPI00083417E6|nr:hypothetical protein [Rufibacter ruber]